MSIQAVAWALEQDFSYTTPKGRQTSAHGAKLVLISLANHADHVSGHCWPSGPTIARESSCNVRSVYRLIAALERNGFIDVKRGRGGADNKQRSNNYWIRFDRQPAAWQFFADDDGEDEAVPENDTPDTVSPPQHDTVSPPETDENATESPTRSDIGVTRHIMLEPSLLEPSVADKPVAAAEKPRSFDPNERKRELDRIKAAEEARRPKAVFVIKDSRAWFAWVDHKRAIFRAANDPRWLDPLPSTCHEGKQGWWMPTLFPQETGPPATADPPPERAKKAG